MAVAVLEYISGPLAENPYRVGKRLRAPFADKYSARVATYRIIYEVHDGELVVIIVTVKHRAQVYASNR
jgi:mRNA-degrading endonuclease RelE of RelBE toxin-antitoxin system